MFYQLGITFGCRSKILSGRRFLLWIGLFGFDHVGANFIELSQHALILLELHFLHGTPARDLKRGRDDSRASLAVATRLQFFAELAGTENDLATSSTFNPLILESADVHSTGGMMRVGARGTSCSRGLD
jgi:hypothetical protein